ncbi:MAG: alpha/beta fold hydrolase [Desulfobacterota bacterium]|nr:alpha/beta fold hydrolase [Thermodesulfobacteriota bacterium]
MSVRFSFKISNGYNSRSATVAADPKAISLEGEKPCTIFLIHGLTGTPNEMRFLAHYFNRKRGYSVVCPRLANHGAPLYVLKKTKWEDFYASAREAFVQLRKITAGPVFTAGLSMGALLSLLLAQEFASDIAGVSCLSPTLFYDGWNVPWYSSIVLPLLCLPPLKYFCYFKEDPPYGIKNRALQQRIHKYYSTATLDDTEGVAEYGYPFFPMTLLHQLKRLVRYCVKILPSVQVPVQLIQAREDDMTSIRNSTFIYEKINSDMKEMVLLENSYHVITADQERSTVARKMDEFFQRIIGFTPHLWTNGTRIV